MVWHNPYDMPSNAVDRQFFSPDDPTGAFNYNDIQSSATESKADPIEQIIDEFKQAQQRQTGAKPRGGTPRGQQL